METALGLVIVITSWLVLFVAAAVGLNNLAIVGALSTTVVAVAGTLSEVVSVESIIVVGPSFP